MPTALDRNLIRDALAELLGIGASKEIGFKHNASGTPDTTSFAHGPGGVLTYPGVDPAVFQTMVGNLPGMLNQLPTARSVYDSPVYEVVTGVKADSGSEKSAVCDDPPAGGIMKAGKIWAPFGRYERRTRELELNRLGLLNNLADPMDLRLVGNPVMTRAGAFGDPRTPGNPLANEMAKALWERAISFNRLLARQIWRGNPANNAAAGGYKEIAGFEKLVTTGYKDAETGSSLPSLDSDVKDFNYLAVHTNGDALVNAITYMARYLRSLATRTGVDPVRWVIVMREEAFYEIAAVWACSYQTYRCDTNASQNVQYNVDSGDVIAMRDAMRAGNYLLIDGMRWEVLLDDGITEDSNTTNSHVPNGSFASDIYFVPMSVNGGQASTYLEYFDMENPSIQAAIGTGLLSDVRVSGPWMEWSERKNQCFWFGAKIEPRLVLRTPWLAGRLKNVVYRPLQHTRQPFPTDPYWVNGGETTRPGPSLYATWKS